MGKCDSQSRLRCWQWILNKPRTYGALNFSCVSGPALVHGITQSCTVKQSSTWLDLELEAVADCISALSDAILHQQRRRGGPDARCAPEAAVRVQQRAWSTCNCRTLRGCPPETPQVPPSPLWSPQQGLGVALLCASEKVHLGATRFARPLPGTCRLLAWFQRGSTRCRSSRASLQIKVPLSVWGRHLEDSCFWGVVISCAQFWPRRLFSSGRCWLPTLDFINMSPRLYRSQAH